MLVRNELEGVEGFELKDLCQWEELEGLEVSEL